MTDLETWKGLFAWLDGLPPFPQREAEYREAQDGIVTFLDKGGVPIISMPDEVEDELLVWLETHPE